MMTTAEAIEATPDPTVMKEEKKEKEGEGEWEDLMGPDLQMKVSKKS